MTKSPYSQLEEYKIKASILHKQLKSNDLEPATQAAVRFQQLPHLKELTPQEILAEKATIKRKHALTVIALENNHASWADLKQRLERQEKLAAFRKSNKFSLLYPQRCAGFINAWYAHYEEARDHLVHDGGFLLPYKNDFFICQRAYIQTLGLDPDDPDWASIGFDWAKPADQDAWTRLDNKLKNISGAQS